MGVVLFYNFMDLDLGPQKRKEELGRASSVSNAPVIMSC